MASNIESLFKTGQALFLNGELDRAREFVLKLISEHAEFQKSYQLMGLISYQAGNWKEALKWLSHIQSKVPDDYIYLGNSAYQLKQYDLAIHYYLIALPQMKHRGRLLHNLALCYYEEANFEDAVDCLKQVIVCLPEFQPAYLLLAQVYFKIALKHQINHDLSGANYYFKMALQLFPEEFEYWTHWLANQYLQGHVKDVMKQCSYFLTESIVKKYSVLNPSIVQELPTLMSLLILCEYSFSGVTDQQLFRRVLEWGNRFTEYPEVSKELKSKKIKRLKIGYVSQEFSYHSSSFLLKSLLKYRNRDKFEVFAYSDSIKQDDSTSEFKVLVDHWRYVKELSDLDLKQMIQQDEIDILIDLGGHTHSKRLLLYALKPAPLQLTGLGFGLPSGLKTMDYFFSDPVCTPLELCQLSREKLLYLPICLLHWKPPDLNISFKKKSSKIVFGCGNAVYKLNDRVIDVWADILLRCPGSVLLLKAVAFSDIEQCKTIKTQFLKRGVAAERLGFKGKTSHKEHLAFYGQLDIVLDPFPYAGGVSTCEALWMGIPVITLATGRRIGVSILSHLKLEQWVAITEEAYIELAISMAKDPELYEHLQKSLRERIVTSSICNGQLYVKNIENAFEAIWFKETTIF